MILILQLETTNTNKYQGQHYHEVHQYGYHKEGSNQESKYQPQAIKSVPNLHVPPSSIHKTKQSVLKNSNAKAQ